MHHTERPHGPASAAVRGLLGGSSMQTHRLTRWLAIGAVPTIALALMLPGADAIGASGHFCPTASGHVAGGSVRVIVMLRDTAKGLAPRSAARFGALRAEEAPLVAALRASG